MFLIKMTVECILLTILDTENVIQCIYFGEQGNKDKVAIFKEIKKIKKWPVRSESQVVTQVCVFAVNITSLMQKLPLMAF